jgi:hypothetical protein
LAVWSIVNFSKIPFDWRLDAEYFKPQYIELDSLLSHANVKLWGNLEGDFITGPFGSAFTVDNYVESSPYRYIRGKDVKPFFLMADDNAYMPEQAFNSLKKYSLNPDDLLVSVVGTLGNVAVVDTDVEQAIFSCKSTAFRSKSIDPYYLCAYLNSSIGQAYLQRKPRGAIQTGLNLDDLYTIPIYIPESKEEEEISNLVKRSWKQLKKSKSLYAEAEALLLHELGLDTLDLSTQKTYVANFSETVEGERLDADYLNPKYTNLIGYLKTLTYSTLGNLATFSNGATPKGANYLEEGIPFLRIQNINTNRLDLDDVVYISEEIHNGDLKRSQLKPGDVLILTHPSRGEAFGTERFTQYENYCPNASPLQPRSTTPGSVGAMIQNFKSISAQQINRRCQPNTIKIWQRNYYEHIVRNEESLQRLRQYIQNNPLSWQEDQLHPDVPSKW